MVLDEKLTVMQVRPNYSILYQFKPTLKLERRHIRTQKHFVSFIKDLTMNWKEGDYFLKSSQGTFAYFTIAGKSVKLLRKSRLGKEYLCWQYFGNLMRNGKKRN